MSSGETSGNASGSVRSTGLLRHRALFVQLVRREIQGRFQGSYFGLVWLIIQPLILLLAYTMVFGVVFKVRWNGADLGPTAYGLAIFVGMALHSIISDCLSRAPTLVTSRASFVKKVVFPLDILAPVQVAAAAVQSAVALGLWLLAVAVFGGGFGWTALMTPLLVLPLVLHALGMTWFLASLGVYVRDVGQGAALILTALLFVSPVFYPLAAVPEPWQSIIWWNPLTFPIEAIRGAVLDGKLPGLGPFVLQIAIGAAVAVLGLKWFRATRQGFADVL
jgi:lipopolysaccharide transport system permease protein